MKNPTRLTIAVVVLVIVSLLAIACAAGGTSAPAPAPTQAPAVPAAAASPAAQPTAVPSPAVLPNSVPSPAAAQPAKPAAATQPIKVAAIAPVSGAAASVGKYMENGTRLALEDFNKGSQTPIELLFEDATSTNTGAGNAVNKLLESKPAAILAYAYSAQFGNVMPILEKEQMATVIVGTTPAIYENGWKWLFGTMPTASVEAAAGLTFIKSKLGKSRVAAFVMNDDVGKAVVSILQTKAKALGVELIPVMTQAGDNDYSGPIAAARRNNPDAYLFYEQAPDLPKIVRQLKQMGASEPMVAHLVATSAVLNLLDPAEAEGLYGWSGALPTLSTDPKVQSFAKRFKERTGLDADQVASHTYDGAMMLFGAVVKAGGDRAKTIENMHAIKGYNGISGEFSYNAKGIGRFETNLVRIGAGKEVKILETVKVSLD